MHFVGTSLFLVRTLGSINGHRRVICRCVCGVEKEYNKDNIRSDKTRSCGCIRREQMRVVGKTYSYRHGATGTPEHTAFIQAKSRCNDKNRRDYKNYGGRGIKFLFDSYEDFLLALGKRPSRLYSLDRINNDGHYEVGNCRWATAKEQRNNQRA